MSPVTFIPTVINQPISFPYHGSATTLTVPVVAYTITFPGGDTQAVGNFEYRIPIAGPVSVSLFADVGSVGTLRRNGLSLDPTGVDNINSQFPLVNQQPELQIASGTNFKIRMSTGIE